MFQDRSKKTPIKFRRTSQSQGQGLDMDDLTPRRQAAANAEANKTQRILELTQRPSPFRQAKESSGSGGRGRKQQDPSPRQNVTSQREQRDRPVTQSRGVQSPSRPATESRGFQQGQSSGQHKAMQQDLHLGETHAVQTRDSPSQAGSYSVRDAGMVPAPAPAPAPVPVQETLALNQSLRGLEFKLDAIATGMQLQKGVTNIASKLETLSQQVTIAQQQPVSAPEPEPDLEPTEYLFKNGDSAPKGSDDDVYRAGARDE